MTFLGSMVGLSLLRQSFSYVVQVALECDFPASVLSLTSAGIISVHHYTWLWIHSLI